MDKFASGSRAIVFGPGDKLAWLESVAMHPETTDLDTRVAIALMNRLDKFTGKAIVGQQWIACAIGRGERSVRDSASRLRALRLVEITAGGGRGKANIYGPVRQKGGSQPPGFRRKPGMQPPGLSEETRQIATLNPADYDTKPGGQPPPLPNRLPNSSSGDGRDGWQASRDRFRDALARLNDFNKRESDEAHREGIEVSDCGKAAWQPIKEELIRRIGPDRFASWFGDLSLIEINGSEAALLAPTPFIRNWITNQFEPQVLDACRAIFPGVERVRVVDRKGLRDACAKRAASK